MLIRLLLKKHYQESEQLTGFWEFLDTVERFFDHSLDIFGVHIKIAGHDHKGKHGFRWNVLVFQFFKSFLKLCLFVCVKKMRNVTWP